MYFRAHFIPWIFFTIKIVKQIVFNFHIWHALFKNVTVPKLIFFLVIGAIQMGFLDYTNHLKCNMVYWKYLSNCVIFYICKMTTYPATYVPHLRYVLIPSYVSMKIRKISKNDSLLYIMVSYAALNSDAFLWEIHLWLLNLS